RILIVDDEENLTALFKRILQKEGYEPHCACSGIEALEKLERESFDLVITDLKMPGMDGLELLQRGKAVHSAVPFVMLTAYGTIPSAVAAMREGAYDYLIKPVDTEELKLAVKKALELRRLSRELERLRRQLRLDLDFQDIVGQSKSMRAVFRLVRMVAKSNATILVQGESGTGKELIARALHQHSERSARPFVAVDCASLPESLLESELFGHMRGAFTGAVSNQKGLFEEAHGGTLFLDEIGETSPVFQLKLLRVLQEGEVRAVGSGKSIQVDVRVIAATNKNLKVEVERKNFREDLFYRLAVVPLALPPLRDRREDIPLLADHFSKKYCKKYRLEPKHLSPRALRLLLEHPWAGNVRELENVIERAILMSPGSEIDPSALLPDQPAVQESSLSLWQAVRGTMRIVEKEKIQHALQMTRGKRAHAARLLGISRAALYKKLKLYDLTS
ncbi:MAG: sigma-54-dependent transcriptional regulator, partial [Candidatus Binatia bacterium]